MENDPQTHPYAHIKGWGIDADPENEPTYPMKHYTGDDHRRSDYERPPQQPVTVEILHSIERPNVTAVFGTSVPPRGLSGRLRRWAFQWTESQYRHWLPLLLADRIDVVEGLIEDFRTGEPLNPFGERGLAADWKYDKKHLATKVAITTAIATAALVILSKRRRA